MGIFENLSEYELADWLEDFVNNQEPNDNQVNSSEEINQVTRTVKPWLKSVKKSMDKILKQ